MLGVGDIQAAAELRNGGLSTFVVLDVVTGVLQQAAQNLGALDVSAAALADDGQVGGDVQGAGGSNNEFVGSNWQTNTASIATQRGVLKNLTGTTLLSQPATREVVAELLFRSIMLQQVTWNANSLSYSDNGATLAKQNLNMEAVTGVVMGNERGNLEGTSVLPEGKTTLSLGWKLPSLRPLM